MRPPAHRKPPICQAAPRGRGVSNRLIDDVPRRTGGSLPVTRRIAASAGLLAVAGLLLAGCGKDIELKSYDPPPERSAGSWKTWVIGDPARLPVPAPPASGSAEATEDARTVERVAGDRTLAQEREARYWNLEPPVRPWLAAALNRWTYRKKTDPVAAARSYALVSVAMYDAIVAAWHWKYAHDRKGPSTDPLFPDGGVPSYPSEHAAIASAAARVLTYAFPEYPAAAFERLAREAGKSRIVAGVSFPSDVEAGHDLGRRVGDAVVARAKADGSSRQWDGQRPVGPGYWQPPPGTKAAPVQPVAGSWRTWVLGSGNRFRAPAPPAADSPGLQAQARRVKEASDGLTARRKEAATRWEGGVGTPQLPGRWNQVALTRVDRRNLSIPSTARMFALLNVAMADAGVAAWDSKYTYWFQRPDTAIRTLGVDRSFRPFLATPASPGHVSEHSALSTAAATVLGHVYPDTAERFRAQAAEAGRSSIYGGIQFPFADEAGRTMGEQVGDLVVKRAQGDGAER